ncbi:MAG: hypothetical protein K2X82_09920, partial [Gemmataceae bacterium]|nr:hypothetical protein [Gemmataceae bacterium]
MRGFVRNWAVRGLILAGVAAVAVAGWVAATWVSPEKVREQVAAALADQFAGAEVRVGAARMRLLGGIAVSDLTLTRKGDGRPFLVVPAAVLHPDKERLNSGRLVVRKVELENPTLHLERAADGRWNVAGVARSGPADRPVPTFVATGATVTVTDHTPGGLPPLKLANVRLTLLNDPLPVLTAHADGTADGLGAVAVRARLNRLTGRADVGVVLPQFPLGEVAGLAAERLAPGLAPHLARFSASGSVRADLTYTPETTPAWRYDVRAEVKDGRLDHPDLPWPAEGLAAKVRAADGRVTVEEATAKVGPARVRVSKLETRTDGASGGVPSADPSPLAQAEAQLEALELSAAGVPLDDALYARLGSVGAAVKRLFAPTGTADLGYSFSRDGAGWRREVEVRPKDVKVVYAKFPYPVSGVTGWVRRATTHRGDEVTRVDLAGAAAGQPVTARGQISGAGPDPEIDLRVSGTNIPLDDALVAALPGRYPDLVRQFHATGRADFVAAIGQKAGVNLCENEFLVTVKDGTVEYDRFPYKLDRVRGRLVVKAAVAEDRPGEPAPPERDELVLDQFTAAHGGATVRLHGSKRPVPGSRDRKLVLYLGGDGCRVDDDLRRALGGLKLDRVWEALSPAGALWFAAEVEVVDRGPPPSRAGAAADDGPPFDPAADLKLAFRFSGPAVTAGFFPYTVTDLSGELEYERGRVGLSYLTGRHGETRVKLDAAEVRFYPDGAVWANFGRLEAKPLVADAALLRALPAGLRAAAEEVRLRGGAELTVNHLVVLTPPDPPGGGKAPPPEPLPLGPAAMTPAGGVSVGRTAGVSER